LALRILVSPGEQWRAPFAVLHRSVVAFDQIGQYWGIVMNAVADLTHRLHEEEIKLLAQLRAAGRARMQRNAEDPSLGERVADRVAATMGSWSFIIIQSLILLVWIILNVTAYVQQWDPYPFILLNLALSFQAAYAAPFIMMSQNRQAAIDRAAAESDYKINAKAELEIELLHQKLDLLRETEVSELIQLIRRLEARLPQSDREAPSAN
jgi:uncharacterized membrane protein